MLDSSSCPAHAAVQFLCPSPMEWRKQDPAPEYTEPQATRNHWVLSYIREGSSSRLASRRTPPWTKSVPRLHLPLATPSYCQAWFNYTKLGRLQGVVISLLMKQALQLKAAAAYLGLLQSWKGAYWVIALTECLGTKNFKSRTEVKKRTLYKDMKTRGGYLIWEYDII